MAVWFICPSKRPPEEALPVFALWSQQGYRIAIQRDDSEPHGLTRGEWGDVEIPVWRPYAGYAEAVNHLAQYVLLLDKTAQWIVAAGDDTKPDANHSAEEIASQCEEHFGAVHWPELCNLVPPRLSTFGVMQCTADRWGEDPTNPNPAWRSAYIDRVAGSPWMGREFCLSVNRGRGPLWPDYYHCFADEELQAVATRLGVFWQRPDLIHLHKHWGRTEPGQPMPSSSLMPDFLKRANSREEWRKAENLFKERKAAGFPGSEPL